MLYDIYLNGELFDDIGAEQETADILLAQCQATGLPTDKWELRPSPDQSAD